MRDLHRISTHATDPDDNGHVAFPQPGTGHGLVRGSYRIRYHRDICQAKPCLLQALLINRAQAKRRHADVRGKAAMYVITGHFLMWAYRIPPAPAEIAYTAGNDGWNNDGRAGCKPDIRGCFDHATADFMTQGERQGMLQPDAVIVKAEVRMAHAAAGHFDHHFTRLWRPGLEWRGNHRLSA
jgi:hypothetical protein